MMTRRSLFATIAAAIGLPKLAPAAGPLQSTTEWAEPVFGPSRFLWLDIDTFGGDVRISALGASQVVNTRVRSYVVVPLPKRSGLTEKFEIIGAGSADKFKVFEWYVQEFSPPPAPEGARARFAEWPPPAGLQGVRSDSLHRR